jgi:hypothetical protein
MVDCVSGIMGMGTMLVHKQRLVKSPTRNRDLKNCAFWMIKHVFAEYILNISEIFNLSPSSSSDLHLTKTYIWEADLESQPGHWLY